MHMVTDVVALGEHAHQVRRKVSPLQAKDLSEGTPFIIHLEAHGLILSAFVQGTKLSIIAELRAQAEAILRAEHL